MRQIKFRAWDNQDKEMIPANKVCVGAIAVLIDIGKEWSDVSYLMDRFSVMMFTGLLDKNGVEIYEGDILKDGKGGLGEVEYRQPQFVVWSDGQHFSLAEGKINMDKLEYTEVIGNIYQHPELLK